MHYTGTLLDGGKEFDSSRNRGPFDFTLGAGMVIKGWDQVSVKLSSVKNLNLKGLTNMCIGEKRRLKIPSDLAYGERGAGADIPPNAALIFEVELLDIERDGIKHAEL